MRVRVHRGSHEVGGSCVEVEHAGFRLVLDVGKPLNAGWTDRVDLPSVPGLADGSDPDLLGVLIWLAPGPIYFAFWRFDVLPAIATFLAK